MAKVACLIVSGRKCEHTYCVERSREYRSWVTATIRSLAQDDAGADEQPLVTRRLVGVRVA